MWQCGTSDCPPGAVRSRDQVTNTLYLSRAEEHGIGVSGMFFQTLMELQTALTTLRPICGGRWWLSRRNFSCPCCRTSRADEGHATCLCLLKDFRLSQPFNARSWSSVESPWWVTWAAVACCCSRRSEINAKREGDMQKLLAFILFGTVSLFSAWTGRMRGPRGRYSAGMRIT